MKPVIYQVIRNEYMAYEYDTDRPLFLTLDKNEAIEKAKEFFSTKIDNLVRPDFMKMNETLENFMHDKKQNQTNPAYFSNQIFVIETELGVDLSDTKIPNKVVWSPSSEDIFNNFSMEIRSLFSFDLSLDLNDQEVSELWEAYKKDPKVVNGTIHYANPVNAAYLIKNLSEYKKEEALFELEINTK